MSIKKCIFFPLRNHLSKQSPDPFHSQWWKWDLGPGGGPVPGWTSRQQGGPGAPHRALDRHAELRLRGLRAGSVHRRSQQGHTPDRTVPEHDRHQVFVQQADGETVRQQPLQEQRGLQRGVEPLHLRLHWDWLLGFFLWKRWDHFQSHFSVCSHQLSVSDRDYWLVDFLAKDFLKNLMSAAVLLAPWVASVVWNSDREIYTWLLGFALHL